MSDSGLLFTPDGIMFLLTILTILGTILFLSYRFEIGFVLGFLFFALARWLLPGIGGHSTGNIKVPSLSEIFFIPSSIYSVFFGIIVIYKLGKYGIKYDIKLFYYENITLCIKLGISISIFILSYYGMKYG